MVAYAVEVGGGTVWAYASRSRMAHSLRATPDDFWIGNMIPIPIPIPIPSHPRPHPHRHRPTTSTWPAPATAMSDR